MNVGFIELMRTAKRGPGLRLSRACVQWAVPVLLAALTAACVTQQQPSIISMRALPSIVAVAEPGVRIPAGASFAWQPASAEVSGDQRNDSTSFQSAVERQIKQNMQAMGYRFVDKTSAHDYSVGYAAALDSSLNDDEIMRRLGLLPGNQRVPAGNIYEKGSLIIFVLDASGRDMLWRSAAQAAADFRPADPEREQRLGQVIKDMFLSFPKAAR